MSAPLSPAERLAARRLYLSDPRVSVAILAASYGVSVGTMHKVLNGVTRTAGRRRKGTMTTERMIEMRDAGITLAQIGKQAGLTESGVLRRIQRHSGR